MEASVGELQSLAKQMKEAALFAWIKIACMCGEHDAKYSYLKKTEALAKLGDSGTTISMYGVYVDIYKNILGPVLRKDPNHEFVIHQRYIYSDILKIAPKMGCTPMDLLYDVERRFRIKNKLSRMDFELHYGDRIDKTTVSAISPQHMSQGHVRSIINVVKMGKQGAFECIEYVRNVRYPHEWYDTIDAAIGILRTIREGAELRQSQQILPLPKEASTESTQAFLRRKLAPIGSVEPSSVELEHKTPGKAKRTARRPRGTSRRT